MNVGHLKRRLEGQLLMREVQVALLVLRHPHAVIAKTQAIRAIWLTLDNMEKR